MAKSPSFIETIITNSLIRVLLVVLVAFFAGIKFPEGVKLTCSLAEVLEVEVEACVKNDGTL